MGEGTVELKCYFEPDIRFLKEENRQLSNLLSLLENRVRRLERVNDIDPNMAEAY